MPKAKVLVVEDEDIIARDIQRSLERFGFRVSGAVASGEEAVKKVAEVRPDLALVDIALTGEMDGIEAARQIRFNFDVPVIYLTADVDEELLERAKLTEPLGYLVTPFEERELLAMIETALSQFEANLERINKVQAEPEARFRAIFAAPAIGITLVDAEGRLLEANAALHEMLGYSEGELHGKTFSELTHPADLTKDLQLHAELVDGVRDGYQMESRIVRKDGGLLWGRLTVAVERDAMGTPQFIIRMLEDITQRVRAQTALHRRINRLALLYSTSLDIAKSNDLLPLLPIIVERAVQALGGDRGALYLCDPEGEGMRCVARYENTALGDTKPDAEFDEGPTNTLTQNERSLTTNDYRAWPGKAAVSEGEQFPLAMLSAPLTCQNRTIGAIHVLHDGETRRFTQDDLELLTLFANQAAIAVENDRLVATEREQHRLIEALRQVGLELVSELDLDSLLRSIVSRAVALLGGVSGGLYLYRAAQDVLEWAVAMGPELTPKASILRPGEGLSGEIWQTGTPLFVNTYRESYEHETVQEAYRIGAVVGAPILWGEKPLGVLNVLANPPRAFSQADADLLSLFATQAAIAIEDARLRAETQKRAIADSLTGLFNRRGLFELGHREIERARRGGEPLVAIMFEPDYLKQVNDTFGHDVGDQVLASLAAYCRQKLRGVDVLGRYGGEVFVALLPNTSLADGQRIAERLRQYTEETPVLSDRGPLTICMSLGVALLNETADDLESLLRRATQALDTAKRTGRNRVHVY